MNNKKITKVAEEFMSLSVAEKYSYNWSFCGRPIIQYPEDVVTLQEILWEVEPDLVIETGIAHGGSILMSAGFLALLNITKNDGSDVYLSRRNRKVIGIDKQIYKDNRKKIENHPLGRFVELIEGSSTDSEVYNKISKLAKQFKKVLVILDSNHTHAHVLRELELYSPFVSKGSYCVVCDTIVEQLPSNFFPNRPWGPKNSPMSAVREFLNTNASFQVENKFNQKSLITAFPGGIIRRIQ